MVARAVAANPKVLAEALSHVHDDNLTQLRFGELYGDEFIARYAARQPSVLVRAMDLSPAQDRARHIAVQQRLQQLQVADEAREIHEAGRRPERTPWDAGTLADQLKKPEPPAGRIEGLMPWEASTEVVAQRKTGKTTLALNMAHSFLTGDPFLGEFPVVPVEGRIALLNHEVSGWQIARWAEQRGIPDDRLFLVNLRGASNPFRDPASLADLGALLRQQNTETVIVDPFGRAFSGDNQNDAGQVQGWLVQLDEFARGMAGARDVVLTVHAGWDGSRARGSSALEDWADSLIYLTRNTNTGARHMRADGRDVEMPERELLLDEHTKTLTLGALKNPGRKDRPRDDLMAAISAELAALPEGHKGLTSSAIRREVGGKSDHISEALRALVSLGFVNQQLEGQSKYHTLVKPFTPAAGDFS